MRARAVQQHVAEFALRYAPLLLLQLPGNEVAMGRGAMFLVTADKLAGYLCEAIV